MKRGVRLLAATGALTATAVLVPLGVTSAAPATTNGLAATCGIPVGGVWRVVASLPCRAVAPAGTSVRLNLNSHFRWSAPTSSSGAVTVTSTRVAPGGMLGTLHAAHAGTATLHAVGVMVCPAGQACPALALLWTLRVTVVGQVSSHGTVTVTATSGGTTQSIQEGDQLVVNLSGPAVYKWSEPSATNASVLDRISGSAGYAIFVAVGTGTATVTAVGSPSCFPRCLMPSRLLEIHVVVTH